LTDYEKRFGAEKFRRFMQLYRERLRDALGDARPYFYTYKRILIWATF
jgi:hypothetical protein